jgi:hypothetical protein
MLNVRTVSTIVVTIAAAGTVATGVLAAKGGRKLANERNDAEPRKKDFLRAYGPAIGAGTAVLGAIAYLGYTNTELGNRLIKEVASHAAAVAASQAGIKALEEKAKEIIGPKKTQELIDTHTEAGAEGADKSERSCASTCVHPGQYRGR